jgi:hypothetical protein
MFLLGTSLQELFFASNIFSKDDFVVKLVVVDMTGNQVVIATDSLQQLRAIAGFQNGKSGLVDLHLRKPGEAHVNAIWAALHEEEAWRSVTISRKINVLVDQ